MIQWLNQPVILWHWLICFPLLFVLGYLIGALREVRCQIRILEIMGEFAEATNNRFEAIEAALADSAPADAREGV